MDGVNKLYHDFFKAFTEVHSTSGTEVQRRANEKWAQLKAQAKVGDMGPYNEEMTKLKHKKRHHQSQVIYYIVFCTTIKHKES